MRVMTVLGTRPEIIRLSRIIGLLDVHCDHRLIHTGQNYAPNLNAVFFRELGLRKADYCLDAVGASFGQRLACMIKRLENILVKGRPDRVLVLGDTDSGLAACLVAGRMGIPVYHLEAGNRCYDNYVPEETNRRVIDHYSDVLLPYTERSRANLLREGIEGQRVFVIGNPIAEVLNYYEANIVSSDILEREGLSQQRYYLATIHRAESVDVESRLRSIMESLTLLGHTKQFPVLCSLHPHTRQRLEDFGIETPGVRLLEPLGFFDFVALQRTAYCVVTDSGTVQEECCIQHVPAVIARDTTERPETVECGASILAGTDSDVILSSVAIVTSLKASWTPPPEYTWLNVSATVTQIVLER